MSKKPLVLFLGNPLFSDDRIGLELGTRLKNRLTQNGYSVELSEKSGFALLDYLEKYDNVIIVDSIYTRHNPVGKVLTPSIEEFKTFSVFSPHYAGITETLQILKALDMNPNCSINIIAIEIEDPYKISTQLSQKILNKIEDLEEEVYGKIRSIY